MTKPVVFISHITEERDLAIALKEFIETKFLRSLEVFASSHEESLKLGDEWMAVIRKSMQNSALMAVICSPISISRPWINFEAGAGWVRDIPVVPLCHSGLTPGDLPVPLSSLQAGKLNNMDDIKKLFSRIASLADIATPNIGNEEFFKVISGFEETIKTSLLRKDTKFVYNLLFRHVELLTYCIYSSTADYEELNDIDLRTKDIRTYEYTFNDIYRLYNLSMLMTYVKEKVYQVFKKTVYELSDNVKFILSNSHLKLSPDLHELLNEFLYSVVIVEDWFKGVAIMDQGEGDKSLKNSAIKIIKDEPLPPQKKFSNVINHYIDYYNSLRFYQDWLGRYNSVMNILLSDAK